MSQADAHAFLSAFAKAATAPSAAPPSAAASLKQPRKLRPVQLPQPHHAANQSSPLAAFSGAPTQPPLSSPFLRRLPQSGRQASNPHVATLQDSRDSPGAKDAVSNPGKHAPTRTRRRPRRFVPIAQFQSPEKGGDAHAPPGTPKEPPSVTALCSAAPRKSVFAQDAAELRSNVPKHVSCLRAVTSSPSHFFPAVKALLSCLHSSTNGEPTSLRPGCQPAEAATYCREVLRKILPLFASYPAPVIKAFRELFPDSELRSSDVPFPAAFGVWAPKLSGPSGSLRALEAEPESVSRRLLGNLETTWDQILGLQRIYRGDLSSSPPGTLSVSQALQAMAMLHPANMDVFAARFLNLVSVSGLESRDTPIKMRQLGERLRDAPPRKSSKKGPGVVLHRLPGLVRSMFEDDPSQLFFLDFLTGVDSARLNTALVPRLVAAIAKELEIAAAATTNVAFTDAVLNARVHAKLLSVTMHASNWAHSAFSLSGMDDNQASPGLGRQSLRRRVPIHSAFFNAAIDVHELVRDAVSSGHVLPVLASVAVADVILRLAGVDPVAKVSEWYRRGVHAVRSVRVVSMTDTGENMPLLHAMISALLESKACREEAPSKVPEEAFLVRCDLVGLPGIGDTRLLRVLCPMLDDLRKSVHMRDTTKATARRITPQVTTKAKSTLTSNGAKEAVDKGSDEAMEEGNVQAALRKEFYARMDGRLRELIRVVAASRPEEGTARDTYLKVVALLYPDMSSTVVTVAANLCAREVGEVEMESKKDTRGGGWKGGPKLQTVVEEIENAGNGIKAMEM